MSRLIKHQMQPTPVTCFCTSVAMLTNTPVADVVEAYHELYYDCKLGTSDILDAMGVPYIWFRSVESPKFERDGAYLITVPSLNIQAGMHSMVLEMVDDDWCVLDPVKGREGRRYYTNTAPTNDLEVMLHGLVIDAFIPLDYIRNRYEASA